MRTRSARCLLLRANDSLSFQLFGHILNHIFKRFVEVTIHFCKQDNKAILSPLKEPLIPIQAYLNIILFAQWNKPRVKINVVSSILVHLKLNDKITHIAPRVIIK